MVEQPKKKGDADMLSETSEGRVRWAIDLSVTSNIQHPTKTGRTPPEASALRALTVKRDNYL
jgi:hypothetical protein